MILINDYNLHGHFCKRAFNPLTSFHDLHFTKTCRPLQAYYLNGFFFLDETYFGKFYFSTALSPISYLNTCFSCRANWLVEKQGLLPFAKTEHSPWQGYLWKQFFMQRPYTSSIAIAKILWLMKGQSDGVFFFIACGTYM